MKLYRANNGEHQAKTPGRLFVTPRIERAATWSQLGDPTGIIEIHEIYIPHDTPCQWALNGWISESMIGCKDEFYSYQYAPGFPIYWCKWAVIPRWGTVGDVFANSTFDELEAVDEIEILSNGIIYPHRVVGLVMNQPDSLAFVTDDNRLFEKRWLNGDRHWVEVK